MTVKVVIGSGFGDEGKGLFTDYLATSDSTVCRFNGGAQAGHTVETSAGRHIFHHFGAGTLKGANTHLSRFFIHNPYFFLKERQELIEKFGIDPVVTADPRGLVTTPYDMMLNQMAEEARGTARHGSCGIGINETIKRHEAYPIALEMLNDDPRRLNDILYEIRHNWVPVRAKALGLTITPIWQTRIDNLNILTSYFDAISQINIRLLFDDDLSTKSLIFEGAQGLLLDENHRFFPYVTHSHTGLHNVMMLAKENGLTSLDVFYLTRAYATRHGAGPFPHETPDVQYNDLTNVPNDWQGNLRFGLLDLDLLNESIENDLKHATDTGITIQANIVVTCVDQVGDTIHFVSDQRKQVANRSDFLKAIKKYNIAYISCGPTRKDIEKYDSGT